MQYARTAIYTAIFVLAAALSAAAQTAPTQEQPDGMDLLKNVELAYGAMNTYAAKVTSTITMDQSGAQGNVNMETPMSVTADASGKFRIESKGMMGMTMIYDGNVMWMYFEAANSYSKLPINESSASARAGAMAGGMSGGRLSLDYKNVTSGVKEAKILRSEKVHVNGADADCWVVSLAYEAPGAEASAAMHSAGASMDDFSRTKTIWVDKGRYLVYREDSTTKMTTPNAHAPTTTKQSSKVESFTVNDPVSPDVFTFTPPPGAKELDTSKFTPKAGQASPTQN